MDATKPNVELLLMDGYYAWFEEDVTGVQTVVAVNENCTILVSRDIINSMANCTTITGSYDIYGISLTVEISQDSDSHDCTVRLYSDGELLAERTDGSLFQQVVQNSTNRLLNTNANNESRLSLCLQPERDPYPFAIKLLFDLETSRFDQVQTDKLKQSGQRLAEAERSSVKYRKVKDYRFFD